MSIGRSLVVFSIGKIRRGHQRETTRILVQQKESKRYFKDIHEWIPDHLAPMDFGTSTRAINFCVSNRISGVQLVLKFEDKEYDIILPVALGPEAPRIFGGSAEHCGNGFRERFQTRSWNINIAVMATAVFSNTEKTAAWILFE